MGYDVGTRLLDLYFVRERNSKREIKLLNMLLFVKSTLWKVRSYCYFVLLGLLCQTVRRCKVPLHSSYFDALLCFGFIGTVPRKNIG